jgi:hypothetical protein
MMKQENKGLQEKSQFHFNHNKILRKMQTAKDDKSRGGIGV